jgi:hypothetical protein
MYVDFFHNQVLIKLLLMSYIDFTHKDIFTEMNTALWSAFVKQFVDKDLLK